MKSLFVFAIFVLAVVFTVSCDVRSETAKKEMQKFSGTPTPTTAPVATPTPVNPADAVQVDTSQTGEVLGINGAGQKKSVNCNKYNAVRVNGDSNVLNVSGTCRQIMINGDNNEVIADAAAEFVFNGTGNTLRHTRYANGKLPSIVQGQQGNTVEKIPFEPGKSGQK